MSSFILAAPKALHMARKYEEVISYHGLTKDQFLMLGSLSLSDLEIYHTVSETEIEGTVDENKSSEQQLSIQLNEDTVNITSRLNSYSLFYNKAAKETVEQVVNTINANKQKYSPPELDEKLQALRAAEQAEIAKLEEKITSGNLTATEKIQLGFGGYYITLGLLGINLLVYILMVLTGVHWMSPQSEDLIDWGGNFGQLTSAGELWRLITNVFIHIGIIHLLFNMYALFSIGRYLEPSMGRWTYLLSYLASGVVASATSIWWHSDVVSAGASGAIFGLYGCFAAMMIANYFDAATKKAMLGSIGLFVVYNLVYGLKSGIDNAAHIGGLLSGFVFGLLFTQLQKYKMSKWYLPVMLLVTVSSTAFIYKPETSGFVSYSNALERLKQIETKALAPLQHEDRLSEAELIRQLKEISLPAWQEAKKIMGATFKLKLSDKDDHQRALLTEYVNLRIMHAESFISYLQSKDEAKARELENIIKRIEHNLQTLENQDNK